MKIKLLENKEQAGDGRVNRHTAEAGDGSFGIRSPAFFRGPGSVNELTRSNSNHPGFLYFMLCLSFVKLTLLLCMAGLSHSSMQGSPYNDQRKTQI